MFPRLIIGNYFVKTNFIAICMSFGLFTFFIMREAPTIGISQKVAIYLCLLLFFTCLFLTRVLALLFHIRRGRVSYGILGGIIILLIFSKEFNIPYGELMDLITPPLALLCSILRIGCFLNGCCRGKQSNVRWAVKYPGAKQKVHPVQIYEALVCVIIFLGSYYMYREHFFPDKIFIVSLLCYFLSRFLLEFLRDYRSHRSQTFFKVRVAHMSQIFCIVVAQICLILLFI